MLTLEGLIAVLGFGLTCFELGYTLGNKSHRDEIRSANLALISGRQMHRINACIFLVAITKNNRPRSGKLRRLF